MPKVSHKYKENRKKRILEAAFICFSKNGYSETSMRDILKESGLSTGALYNYYSGKKEILYDLVLMNKKNIDESLNKSLIESGNDNSPEFILEIFLEMVNTNEAIMSTRADISIWDAALKDKGLMEIVSESFKSKALFFNNYLNLSTNSNNTGAISQIMISLIQGAAIQKMINKDFDIIEYKKAANYLLKSLKK